jgi:DNA mismatch repair protein MutL
MGNIVLLDELTINKIAAGEVIERPASVIKEMVENSIDAGATNITVEIKNGGISYIKVTDNGKGIPSDDLEIAFERHATSKIRSADDLNTVTSMGFRGEALASIAAIANVEMVSKTKEQEIGNKIIVEAGNVIEKEEIGCQTGTSITVRNLFFNTPVRYKFLKKDYTESGYVEDAITRIALVHPEISIRLINTGKTIIQTTGNGDLKSVIYSIYGKDIANGIMEVSYNYEDMHIKGVVGKPEIARSNRSNQLFFVNKRFIKDKTLTAATEQAYKGLIPIGKFGFVVLNIEMNPAKVDVNVHPAKLEVRFEEENKVFQSIYHAIKDTLLKSELVANTEKTTDTTKISEVNHRELSFDERLKNLKESKKENEQSSGGLFSFRKQNEKQIENYTEEESKMKTNILEDVYNSKNITEKSSETKDEDKGKENSLGKPIDTSDVLMQLKQMKEKLEKELEEKNITPVTVKEENTKYKLNTEETKNVETPLAQKVQESIDKIENQEVKKEFEEIKQKMQDLNDNPKVVSEDFNEMYAKLFGRKPVEEKLEEKKEEKTNAVDLIKDNISVFTQTEQFNKPTYKFIGIVFKTYIILEIDNEMYILDQHAAHERIMYEKVKKNYYSETNKDSQMLLLPDIITLTHKEMDIAKDNMKMFEQAGFTLEEFGENTIKLIGVPTICLELDTKELFLETLDEINTVARTAKQEKEEKFIATVACKAAVKANMALTTQEVESLMDKLLQLPNPFTCPHGRPTAIKMTKYDIERKFARK